MSDLISRSAAMENYCNALCPKLQKGEYCNDCIVKAWLNNQPTAYDVDKVVEELESFAKLAEDRWTNGTSKNAYQERKCWVKAIEIVKHGGISDDACEWKYNDTEYYWESSCEHLHIFMSDGPKQNEYSFCPYCGKKIKVVE